MKTVLKNLFYITSIISFVTSAYADENATQKRVVELEKSVATMTDQTRAQANALKLDKWQKKISSCSVVAFAKYERDEDALRAIVVEYFRIEKGVKPPTKIGEEFRQASHRSDLDLNYGEGIILFFEGETASSKGGTAVHDGKIDGILLNDFRKLCQQLDAEQGSDD